MPKQEDYATFDNLKSAPKVRTANAMTLSIQKLTATWQAAWMLYGGLDCVDGDPSSLHISCESRFIFTDEQFATLKIVEYTDHNTVTHYSD